MPEKRRVSPSPSPAPRPPRRGAARLTERSRPTVWRTLRTPDGVRPGPREQQREARAHGEAWYQALRRWDVEEVPLAPCERGSPQSRTMQVVGIGAYSSRRGPALGGNGGVARYVRTPGPHRLTEREIGAEITAMTRSASADLADLGDLLERVRGETSLCSLADERGGWASPKERALRYARAVLTLAVRLGDPRAEPHLAVVSVLHKSGD